MKKVLLVLSALLLCLGVLSACGGSEPALSGKYVISSFAMGADEYTPEQLADLGMDPAGFYIEFHDADNCTLMLMGVESSGTYAVNGNALAITSDGATDTMTLNEAKTTITAEDPEIGGTLVFEKETT